MKFSSLLSDRRMAALLMLGFGSGLPIYLTGGNLQAWMKDRGFSLSEIGYFSALTFPYVLKFIWAPAMDRYVPPLLGRRRGWLIVTQVALVLGILLLAAAGDSPSLRLTALAALLVAFCGASQDIVADAYRTDVLEEDERGYGASVFVTGYRVAMVAAGAGALYLVGEKYVSWPASYALMAAAMGIGIFGTLVAPEPPEVVAPQSLFESIVPPLRQFLATASGWMVLAFVLVFRLPDTIAGTMTVPFLLDIGVGMSRIGLLRNGLGLGVTIVGTILGGQMINRLGLKRTVWIVAFLQAASNAGFLWLSISGHGTGRLVTVLVIENLCGGLAVAGFFSFLMAQCDRRYSATQYALMSSIMAVGGIAVGAFTGTWAQRLGWPAFFGLSIAAATPGFLILPWVRWHVAPETFPRGFDVIFASGEKDDIM